MTSKENSELSEDAGPRVGVGAVSCSVACHVTESCFIPLPVVEWSMSKDFSPLAGEIILDNLQTLRCTITGLTTVRLLLTDVPSPASHTGILVADAYSPRDGRHPVLWQQLPFVKCDMSGIHNLSLTEGEADSMKHFVGCHVLRDQKETALMRALEAAAFWITV